jgi:hypothetical protein
MWRGRGLEEEEREERWWGRRGKIAGNTGKSRPGAWARERGSPPRAPLFFTVFLFPFHESMIVD